MTDKEIIRAKIAGEIEKLQEKLHFTDAESDAARNIVLAIKTLEPILAFIDSLQEEPVATKVLEDMLNAKTPAESLGISAEEHDRIVDELIYGKEPEMVDVDDLTNKEEEPVSEDLENEIDIYLATRKWREVNETFSAERLVSFARHFANWQKKKYDVIGKDLEEAAENYAQEAYSHPVDREVGKADFILGAKWQFERIKEALLSEVLPCFMHGGEADEVVAKLDEVLNFQKK